MAGRLFFGSLRPGPDASSVEVVADWGNDVLPLDRVARVQLVKSGFWDRMDGSIDAGASYASSTELLQLDLDAEIKYRRPKFEARASADAVLTQQPEAEDTQRGSLTLATRGCSPTATGSSRRRHSSRTASSGSSCARAWWAAGRPSSSRNERNELAGRGRPVGQPREARRRRDHHQPRGGVRLRLRELRLRLSEHRHPGRDHGLLGLSQWGRFRLEASASLKRELFPDFYFGLRATRASTASRPRRARRERLGPDPVARVLVLSHAPPRRGRSDDDGPQAIR